MWNAGENPGNIRSQVGAGLNAIRNAIMLRDVEQVADLTVYLVTVAAPKLDPEVRQELKEKLALVEGYHVKRDKNGQATRRIYRACNEVAERVLCNLAESGIYAYLPPEVASAKGLALTEDDDDPEPQAPEA